MHSFEMTKRSNDETIDDLVCMLLIIVMNVLFHCGKYKKCLFAESS